MDIYNNKTIVYDAIQDKDIEVLAPTHQVACDYEEFLYTKNDELIKYKNDNPPGYHYFFLKIQDELLQYRHNNRIILDFLNKKCYLLRPKQPAVPDKELDRAIVNSLNGVMTGRLSVNPLIIGLTVPLDTAYEHVKDVLNRPDLTIDKFQAILSQNGIHNFSSIATLNSFKDSLATGNHSSRELNEMKSILHELADALDIAESRIRFNQGKASLVGKTGEIYYLDKDWYLSVSARSKRHGSSIANKLSFMRYVQPFVLALDKSWKGLFRLTRLPTPIEAATIRELVGIKKAGRRPRKASSPFPVDTREIPCQISA